MSKKELKRGYFDIETDPFLKGREPIPFCSDAFIDGTHNISWGDCNVDYLINIFVRCGPVVWYAHNGGKFDFHLIIKPLLKRFGKNSIRKILVIGGRIVQIIFHSGMELRDSYALIPRPLREWAKDDIDYKKLEKDVREEHKDEIIKYLKKDTEYLSEMVDTFVETYGLHLTLASAAFKILHKEFGVKKCSLPEPMDARFRKFYFAGRVEFHKLGKLDGEYTCVDINSSFPWSMTQSHWEGDEFITVSELPKRNLEQSFIRCKAKSSGAFPFREEDGSVSFPMDLKIREFFVTGWEFVAAQSLGLLRQCSIISCHVPLKTRDYSQYIEYFYKIKEHAEMTHNKGERLFAKLLMNSGYGKFGMDPREFEEHAICEYRQPPDKSEHWRIIKDDPKEGITIYARSARAASNSFNNVCVAASITGCSRALLLRAKQICKGVVYNDTDSLMAKDISKLKIGHKLGEWKIESVFSELYIAGKKLYAGLDKLTGKWKTASKGVKLSHKEIIRVALGETVQYEFDAPSYSIRNIREDKDRGNTKWLRFTRRKVRRADLQTKRLK